MSYPRRPLVRPLALAVSLLACAAPAAAQEEAAGGTFEESARVTAIDLTVAARGLLGRSPERLAPQDLVILEGGKQRPVVSVAPLGTGEGEEPWRLVVYFDLLLTPPNVVQASGIALAERVEKLVALGPVEVVVADPEPRPLLEQPTRDPVLVEDALARAVLQHTGRDALQSLRRQVLAAASGDGPAAASGDGPAPERGEALPPGIPPAELAAAAVAEEVDLVHRAQDALLTWAAVHRDGGPQALLLVSGGYDLDPAAFYRGRVRGATGLDGNHRQLADATTRLARTLAGYGWLIYPLVLTEAAHGPTDASKEFEAYREGSLEQVRGEAVTVPLATLPLGKKKAAAEGLEGRLLAEPMGPLAELASAASGAVVTHPAGVDDALSHLDERFRVTFQTSGIEDGKLHPVEVRSSRGGIRIEAPGWVRSATPETLTEARVRRMRGGWFEVGDLAVTARIDRQEEDAGEGWIGGLLTVRADLAAGAPAVPDPRRATLRVTVAHGTEDGAPIFAHQVLTGQDLSGASWSFQETLNLPADSEWLVVVVEELITGTWGARDLEP